MVPPDMRDKVATHVRCHFEIRNLIRYRREMENRKQR